MTNKLILLFTALCFSINLFAQEVKTTEIEEKVKKLEQQIKEIKAKLNQEEQENELQKLLEEAEELSTQKKKAKTSYSKKFMSGTRKQSGLNPNISLGGDFFASYSDKNHPFITEPSDYSYGSNGLHLREAELGLESPLDPFTRGKAFISIGKEGISIEEAYMELLNLPLNMNLKAGIFYAEFGPLNRYHDHALPQFDRPRALVNYFGTGGLGGAGLAANFMLPTYLFSDASSLDLSLMNSGNDFSFTSSGPFHMLYLAQLKNYYDVNKNSYIEYSLNGATGRNDAASGSRSYITSLGLSYKWTPVGREKYRTFDWKNELFYGMYETAAGTIKSKGFYSSLQYKLNARFWISGRIGYSELPYDNQQSEWDYTLALDFWQSEFVFFRLQYQYNDRDLYQYLGIPDIIPSNQQLILQVCWAMGPHKHEAY